MPALKLYNCDFGVTYNGVNYDFTHVDSLVIEDPERTRLVRGANAGNKLGLVYKEGLKEAKTVTVTLVDVPKEIHELLKTIFAEEARVDVYCVDRTTGSSKIGKNAVLSQEPKQLSLDDTAESMSVALIFETFDITEVLKA